MRAAQRSPARRRETRCRSSTPSPSHRCRLFKWQARRTKQLQHHRAHVKVVDELCLVIGFIDNTQITNDLDSVGELDLGRARASWVSSAPATRGRLDPRSAQGALPRSRLPRARAQAGSELALDDRARMSIQLRHMTAKSCWCLLPHERWRYGGKRRLDRWGRSVIVRERKLMGYFRPLVWSGLHVRVVKQRKCNGKQTE